MSEVDTEFLYDQQSKLQETKLLSEENSRMASELAASDMPDSVLHLTTTVAAETKVRNPQVPHSIKVHTLEDCTSDESADTPSA